MITHRTKIILLSLLLVFAVLLGLSTYAAAKIKRPFKEFAPKQTVIIESGNGGKQIASILKDEGIINSDKLFVYYLLLSKASNSLQAGEYELSASMTIPEIVRILSHGDVVPNEVRIRIGEGWKLDQIAEEIQKSGLGTVDDFYKLAGSPPYKGSMSASRSLTVSYEFLQFLPLSSSLEGYLFPDTYFVSIDGGIEELIHKALSNFEDKTLELFNNSILIDKYSIHELVTMASIVEAEVGRNVSGRKLTDGEMEEMRLERYLVAGVFYNRLKNDIGLESDATVGYATGKFLRQSTFADLEVVSLYNTYKNRGLPPGPIGSPSLDAIKAALDPAVTDYLFFLSDIDGKAYFAKTLKEHNENRTKYLPLQ